MRERDGQDNLVARYTTCLHIGFAFRTATYFCPEPNEVEERTIELTTSDIELWEAMASTRAGAKPFG
jgi:hypothetical protein